MSEQTAVESMRRPRVLFILYSPLPAGGRTRFDALADVCSGDIVAPHRAGAVAPTSFGYVTFTPRKGRGLWQTLREGLRCLQVVRHLHSSGKSYDCIVAFGLFKSALAGSFASRWYRTRLIIEVPILPRQIVLYREPGMSLAKSLEAWLMERCASRVLRGAHHLKLIFPDQAARICTSLARVQASAFPDFVALAPTGISHDEDFILLLGTPLHLKGADLAIAAFKQVLPQFPTEQLHIVGSAQGFGPLQRQIGSDDPILLIDYLPHEQALAAIRRAKIVLIPSRTDAMPRVAVEAMAAGKPIIASRIDGMAHYLRAERNCLLIAPGNIAELATSMRRLLADATLRRRLGEQARHDALTYFSERDYARRFGNMLADCVAGRSGGIADYD